MFRLREPSEAEIRRFLAGQAALDFTYAEVGATATQPPAGYVVDQTRIRIGDGVEDFENAKLRLQGWRQFDLGWVRAFPADTPLRAGETVAVTARTFGVWSLNAARVVYTVDEPRRFGFAYGTLPGHVECGEERFLIERSDDDAVWYDIRAFSRPRHVLAKIGYPWVRRLQKRFGRDSAAAMRRAVGETTDEL